MNRLIASTFQAVSFQVSAFAVAAALLFGLAAFYPTPTQAAESQTVAAGQSLVAGASQWLPFDYAGDGEVIEVWVESNNESVTFAVWTPDQLAQEADDPIGRGSADDFTAGDFYWTGEFYQAGTYYLEVENPSGAADTYNLYLASDSVTLPASAETATTTESTGAVTESVADGTSGTSTVTTLSVQDRWTAIGAGETVWYTVAYSGDEEKIEVWLENDNDAVTFAVYTTAQYSDDDADPVGRGSADDNTPADLYWTGDFLLPDTLHIAVTNDGSGTNYYNLHIEQ